PAIGHQPAAAGGQDQIGADRQRRQHHEQCGIGEREGDSAALRSIAADGSEGEDVVDDKLVNRIVRQGLSPYLALQSIPSASSDPVLFAFSSATTRVTFKIPAPNPSMNMMSKAQGAVPANMSI